MKQSNFTKRLLRNCKCLIKEFNKIYAKKPTAHPKFGVGDMVQAGNCGIVCEVISVDWAEYAGHYVYTILRDEELFVKAEYVLYKL